MKKILKFFTSKMFLYGILFIAQFAFIILILGIFNSFFNAVYVTLAFEILGAITAVYINGKYTSPEYKIAWIIVILCVPIIGLTAYAVFSTNRRNKKNLKAHLNCYADMSMFYLSDDKTIKVAENEDAFFASCAKYLNKETKLPVLPCERVEYYKIGEEYQKAIVAELKKAKKYIFMEYFIIEEGVFWNEILDVLKQKARDGVDVRLIYDDFGCLLTLPNNYYKTLQGFGIKTLKFNKLRPILDIAQNNRTHRKITVIDGQTAFTGGINLADEYINKTVRFGHWKDSGMMLKGECAQNFTAMFLQIWLNRDTADYNSLLYTPLNEKIEKTDSLFCVPFCDTPYNENQTVCKNLYIRLIQNAKKYVYINTPYLIIDSEMRSALITSAKSGTDIRITVPHIPDKKIAFALTKAFYSELAKHGVKIYEYTPGFVHAKSLVCDDKYVVVGSSNMDYRSFYLHFECDAFVYNKDFALSLKKDYLQTCDVCEKITKDKIKTNFILETYRSILRLFAPLM